MEGIVQEHDIRAEVIGYYKPDVSALAETWLKGDEVINMLGYNFLVTIENNKQECKKRIRWCGCVN